MTKTTKLAAITFIGGLALGLMLNRSLVRIHFDQSNVQESAQATKPARVMAWQAINKSDAPRTVQLVSDNGKRNFTVPLKAVLVSEAENSRMMDAVTNRLSGKARVSIEENGKQSLILKDDKITIVYSNAWFPFNKKS